MEGRANRSLYLGFGRERQTRTISLLIPSAASLWRAEQIYQEERIVGGIGKMFVSMQCSECQSDGNFKQVWVSGGRSHDSLKIASALNFQSDGNSNTRCSY